MIDNIKIENWDNFINKYPSEMQRDIKKKVDNILNLELICYGVSKNPKRNTCRGYYTYKGQKKQLNKVKDYILSVYHQGNINYPKLSIRCPSCNSFMGTVPLDWEINQENLKILLLFYLTKKIIK